MLRKIFEKAADGLCDAYDWLDENIFRRSAYRLLSAVQRGDIAAVRQALAKEEQPFLVQAIKQIYKCPDAARAAILDALVTYGEQNVPGFAKLYDGNDIFHTFTHLLGKNDVPGMEALLKHERMRTQMDRNAHDGHVDSMFRNGRNNFEMAKVLLRAGFKAGFYATMTTHYSRDPRNDGEFRALVEANYDDPFGEKSFEDLGILAGKMSNFRAGPG